MMVSRGLFGWSPPHVQPLTPVSEVSEPPESPSPFMDIGGETSASQQMEAEEEMEEMEDIEPPPAAVPFSRLFACADRFDWFLMVVGSIAAAAHGTALVVYLHYFAKVIRVPQEQDMFHRFKELALTIVYIAGGVFVAGWIEVSCWILTGERQTAVIRSKYVRVLLNQDMSFFDTYGNNGDIVSQVLSDVLLIQSALSEKVGNYIHNMATFFSGLGIAFINCWQIALITLATGPFIVAAGGISNIFLHRLAENIQDAYAEAASIAEQAVSYIRTLSAFTNETLAKYSYATSLQATLRYGILISLVQGLGLGFTYGLAICSCALQLWVGRFLVIHGKAHGGEIITALFAVILSGLGLNQAATNFYSFDQGRIAAYRLFEMISRSSSSFDHDGSAPVSVQGNIEFRNVYFSYLSRPEIPILSGFYLTVPAKKTVALVGRNGSGKSSIIPLMERFYDPTLGEVLLDGENIKNLKLEWLRSQIGLVTQEPALLSLSIRDNIAYGRDTTTDQIEEAAKIAHAHTFISSLDKGYDTQIGRAGLALTEEQKIKLSIARAVLLNPSILLLDEVTGGLDFEAERSVQEALDLLMLGRSTIIIARRLSLIKNADYIAVMEEGQLVEMGTHDELLSLGGLYAELLRCEEATKLPKRMPARNYKKTAAFQIEKDSSESHSCKEPSSPRMMKSPSLQRVSAVFRPSDGFFNLHESPQVQSPPPEKMMENGQSLDSTEKEPSIKRQDSFEMRLPELPKIDVQSVHRQTSNGSDPESPVSPLLTSDPKNERSHSQTFSRPDSYSDEFSVTMNETKDARHRGQPSFWRLAELSFAEWLYAVLGSIGAAIFGAFNPLLAYVIGLVVTTYYRIDDTHHLRGEIDKWCLIIACMGIVTVVANFLQHFYFGIMGEKMTERVRRMMFSAMLRNEIGWYDDEENSADNLSMRLANDATFVRAAFSNRLSIFIQDIAAVVVAFLIGVLLHWRIALVALATLPVLCVSAIAQKLWLAGFSRGIQEMHRKASLVLEDAVRNIYTVVAFCAGNKVMELYRLQLNRNVIVAALILIWYCARRRFTWLRKHTRVKRLLREAAGNSIVPLYAYKDIEKATNSFSDKHMLGTGAFGTVYAGKLHNDEFVAIKKIRHRDTNSVDQVMNEIKLLSSVSHPNLVRLLGCCIEEGEQILVYEYMPHGTLSQHLQRERGKGLPWTIRLTIASETANAIAYLHSAIHPPIYHRDIKSSNILLDYNYKSKVADFGLSRLGLMETSHISTAPQGTPGYVDPQYHQNFHLSDKSDVYSFGVVLVEIITAMKVVDFGRPQSEINLAALAVDRIRRGSIDEIVDPFLEPNRDAWTLYSIHKVAELAFRCLAFHSDTRPTMMEVAEELEYIRRRAWATMEEAICLGSSVGSGSSSPRYGSENSVSGIKLKTVGQESEGLIVPPKNDNILQSMEMEVMDSSPVSVHNPWSSGPSSPSTNSLLGNVVR